jgi:hypothetical protein
MVRMVHGDRALNGDVVDEQSDTLAEELHPG